jgi:hypothetical protein
VISLQQTDDEAADRANFHRLISLLRDFPGRDEVKLIINNGEKATNLRLHHVTTGYCPELHERLVELVGENSFRLETR